MTEYETKCIPDTNSLPKPMLNYALVMHPCCGTNRGMYKVIYSLG